MNVHTARQAGTAFNVVYGVDPLRNLSVNPAFQHLNSQGAGQDTSFTDSTMFWISAHVLIVLLALLPVVPCSHGTDLAVWMQEDTSGVFLKDYSYSTIWSTVGRSPLSRTWLCLARKSRSFSCHKTRRHTSMMILLLMLSGDVEINPGPGTFGLSMV